jgi:hypothetical protein
MTFRTLMDLILAGSASGERVTGKRVGKKEKTAVRQTHEKNTHTSPTQE